jgi:hypothetical protein
VCAEERDGRAGSAIFASAIFTSEVFASGAFESAAFASAALVSVTLRGLVSCSGTTDRAGFTPAAVIGSLFASPRPGSEAVEAGATGVGVNGGLLDLVTSAGFGDAAGVAMTFASEPFCSALFGAVLFASASGRGPGFLASAFGSASFIDGDDGRAFGACTALGCSADG